MTFVVYILFGIAWKTRFTAFCTAAATRTSKEKENAVRGQGQRPVLLSSRRKKKKKKESPCSNDSSCRPGPRRGP